MFGTAWTTWVHRLMGYMIRRARAARRAAVSAGAEDGAEEELSAAIRPLRRAADAKPKVRSEATVVVVSPWPAPYRHCAVSPSSLPCRRGRCRAKAHYRRHGCLDRGLHTQRQLIYS